jgi:hypothetical protein
MAPVQAPRRDMMAEARRIVDEARGRGIVLRLFGGLAVREHCKVVDFCERDYADLDLIGLSGQARQIAALMLDLGYGEDAQVRHATDNTQRQFYRECVHQDEGGRAIHDLDRVDVFLDTFHMDHEIRLKDRLTLSGYTIPVTDVLLTKLQVVRHNEKDVRDILTLLKDVDLADVDEPDVVNVQSLAARCAGDWGLYHDVMMSLDLCRRLAGRYALDDNERTRVDERIGRLKRALEAAPKSVTWRLRARVGTRVRWYDEVEEQGA